MFIIPDIAQFTTPGFSSIFTPIIYPLSAYVSSSVTFLYFTLFFSKKVLGIVNADGLDQYILIDRSKFDEANPAFNEVLSWVNKCLFSVSKFVKQNLKYTQSISRFQAKNVSSFIEQSAAKGLDNVL